MKKKPIIIKSNLAIKLFSLFMPIAAITLWPFIFVKEDYARSKKLINHETIHFRQYQELWVVGFLIIYLYDWVHGLIKYRDTSRAYFRIRFEQEAYRCDGNLSYLEARRPYAWKKYDV